MHETDTARLCQSLSRALSSIRPRLTIAVGRRLAVALAAAAMLTGAAATTAGAHAGPLARTALGAHGRLSDRTSYRRHAPRRGRGRRRCAHSRARIGQASRHQMQAAVACLINRVRRAHGLPALRISRRLNRSAEGWTQAMVHLRDFSHGADFAARISATGFRWSAAGENIASGYDTPAAVVAAWMASPGHCRNILSPMFSFVGTGVSRRGLPGFGRGTWTQDFALPAGHRPPSANFGPAAGCPY